MANAKNTKPAPAEGALLAALTEPAAPVAQPVPAPPTAPEGEDEPEILEAVLEEATPADLIKALIDALGLEIDEVATIEIRRPGIIRVVGTDRSLRSRRFEWPNTWEAAE